MNYISERLGHKDGETTWKTYSHILDEMREMDEEEITSILEKMLVQSLCKKFSKHIDSIVFNQNKKHLQTLF